MYLMPAEWNEHEATMLSWPGNKETWGDGLLSVRKKMSELALTISEFENVLLFYAKKDESSVFNVFDGSEKNITLINIEMNDSWIRDYGPIFVNDKKTKKRAIINFHYNSWGEKYPPFDDDAFFKKNYARLANETLVKTSMILEGGSIDTNGKGILLTTESCLLNKNRNPEMTKNEIEENLKKFLGINYIVWLKSGIIGDDTDGHIDDFCRFIDEENIIIARTDKSSEDYKILEENYSILVNDDEIRNKNLKVHSIPMPSPYYCNHEKLPLSYANFYFCNDALILPVFGVKEDEEAITIFKKLLPGRKIIPFNSLPFLSGLGGIHCLTQQVIKG